MNVVVILSTFNGEKYIEAQLDSILKQKHPCRWLLIRDDGSCDKTLALLQAYQDRYPQIHLLEGITGNLGVQRSYALLLKEARMKNADYVLFADQDDVWFPDKIEKILGALLALKAVNKPALAFSDVTVVDSQLRTLHRSYEKSQQLKLSQKKALDLKTLLSYCPILACTMIINRELLDQLMTIPPEKMLVDKWALLLAVTEGVVHYLPEPTLLYRQHDRNVSGGLHGIKRKLWSLKNIQFIQRRYQIALNEARDLQTLRRWTPGEQKKLKAFIEFFNGGLLRRILCYFHFFWAPPHWKRKLGLFVSLFFKYE